MEQRIEKIEELLDLPKQVSLSYFDRYVSRYIERKSDQVQALKEINELIGQLQNHVSLFSVYLKQKMIRYLNDTVPKEEDTEFYTRQEVALRYRVSMRTISNWVVSGLETTVIGGVVRISKQAIDDFVRRNKRKKFHWRSIAAKPLNSHTT